MRWDFLFFLNSALLGVGLAMDAFSVSLVRGMNDPRMKKNRMALVAGTFGYFQAFMPMLGWICVRTVAEQFEQFRKWIPYIALILLLFIGGKMLVEGILHRKRGEEGTGNANAGFPGLLLQGVATSIDALSVGFTIAGYPWQMALVCSLLIATVTFAICLCGLLIGKKFGAFLSGHAEILGGVILILIGIEIFLKGILS